MDPSAILKRAIVLVGASESDPLTRAALAIQNSEFGAGRKVEAIIAQLENRNPPRTSPLEINALRAIVMRETGISIELDDPLLLLLVATQDVGLDQLKQSITKHRAIEEKLRFALLSYQTLFYSLLAIVISGILIFYLL